ncbi:hypothetical protein BH10PAT3_BH10PAT3_1880 [soil metagenome]
MSYFYHGVPEPMVGTLLIPLNRMPSSMTALHNMHLKKYDGREEITKRRIPLLDCLWNDVVQFLPLHPRKVFELQVKLGLIPTIPNFKFFEIDPGMFDLDKTVVYFKSAPGEENIEVTWLKDVNLSSLQDIPIATVEYYESLVGTGELSFNYQFIPHILYEGAVDISSSRIVTI